MKNISKITLIVCLFVNSLKPNEVAQEVQIVMTSTMLKIFTSVFASMGIVGFGMPIVEHFFKKKL